MVRFFLHQRCSCRRRYVWEKSCLLFSYTVTVGTKNPNVWWNLDCCRFFSTWISARTYLGSFATVKTLFNCVCAGCFSPFLCNNVMKMFYSKLELFWTLNMARHRMIMRVMKWALGSWAVFSYSESNYWFYYSPLFSFFLAFRHYQQMLDINAQNKVEWTKTDTIWMCFWTHKPRAMGICSLSFLKPSMNMKSGLSFFIGINWALCTTLWGTMKPMPFLISNAP